MASFHTWALVLLAAALVSADLGTRMTIDETPYLAQLENRVLIFWTQTCVATIVTNVHMIISASCVSGTLFLIDYRRVIVGSTTRANDDADYYSLSSVTVHPDFGVLGNEADLAIIRLENYLTFSHIVAQAQILGEGVDLPDNLRLRLASWGNTAQGGGSTANNYLYGLDLFTINNDDCLLKYLTTEEPEIITENMVCAGFITTGRDFDIRDTGAPLTYNDVVVGVLSFGVSDVDDQMPVVSTAIASYTSWIVANAV